MRILDKTILCYVAIVSALALWRVRRQRPKWVTLNDNFGKHPSRVAERMAQGFLDRASPQPSRFERA